MFEGGEVVLTNLRILWARPGDISRGQMCISLPLFNIVLAEEEQRTFSFSNSRKFILYLSEPHPGLYTLSTCERNILQYFLKSS